MKDGWSKVSLFTKNQLWDRKERENWRFLRRSRKSEGNDDDCLSSILWERSGGNIGKHQFVWENNQFMSFLTKSVWFFVIYSLIFSSRLLEYMESAHTAIMPRFLAHNLYSKKCRIFKRQWDCLSLSIISNKTRNHTWSNLPNTESVFVRWRNKWLGRQYIGCGSFLYHLLVTTAHPFVNNTLQVWAGRKFNKKCHTFWKCH